jgi:hypothetical protein
MMFAIFSISRKPRSLCLTQIDIIVIHEDTDLGAFKYCLNNHFEKLRKVKVLQPIKKVIEVLKSKLDSVKIGEYKPEIVIDLAQA